MPSKLSRFWQELIHRNVGLRVSMFGSTFCLIALFSIYHQCVYGQNQKVADSLALIYKEDKLQVSEKLALLYDLAYNELNDRELRRKYIDELIALSESEKNDTFLLRGFLEYGQHHMRDGEMDSALQALITSAELSIDIKDTIGEAMAYITIADVYSIMENYDNADLYYNKSIQILRHINDSITLASALLNAGDFYFFNDKYEKALQYFEESGPIFEKLNHLAGTAYYLGNTAMIYTIQGKDSLAMDHFSEAINKLQELEDFYPISVYLTYMSDIYLRQNKNNQAISCAKRSLELALNNNLIEQISDANHQLSEVYEQAGSPEKALQYFKNYIIYRDSLKNIETVQQLADLRTDFEVSQKQIEVDLLNQKRQNQRIINIAAAITSVLIFLLAMGFYSRYKFAKKTNVKIEEQRDEIEMQRDLVVKQKNEIIDSINYAQRIQLALLPPEPLIFELLDDVFILYKPRDIVSGDFYWIKQVHHYTILVAADCTGHGVPGAFMSMLGISYLNEIVQRREITQANQVLNELRSQIKHSLRQHGNPEESKDGIDMALCVIDEKNQNMQYSGANNPLYLIRENQGTPELEEYKADKMPLGYYQGKAKTFTNHDIPLEMGDTFYIFSDGFIDQKGGKNNKKFMTKNFKDLLLEIHEEPMINQKRILDRTVNDWMGDNSQIDDILVIGFRV